MTDTKRREIDYRQVVPGQGVVKIHFPVAVICLEILVSIRYHLMVNSGPKSQRYMKREENLIVKSVKTKVMTDVLRHLHE